MCGEAMPKLILSDLSLPKDMSTLYDSSLAGLSITVLEQRASDVLDSLTCSEEQCANVNSITADQSKSPDWFRFRVGRVTASNLKRVLSTDPAAPSLSLLEDICSVKREAEVKNVQSYNRVSVEDYTGRDYQVWKIRACGFATCKPSALFVHTSH